MISSDGKEYETDCLTSSGVDILLDIVPKKRIVLKEWLKGKNEPLDKQSKTKAYDLINSNVIKDIEVGTTKGLQQINSYIFDGLYDFAGKICKKIFQKAALCLLILNIF